ncbi:helix-turn-helix transcriptional regulator [Corynebacterium auriscanis]|uniref:helix-turn-helix transcriptional regulator n=1 Tax=Corynebacterium auriscanis TaxID=99807 RepID=UPI003CF9859B
MTSALSIDDNVIAVKTTDAARMIGVSPGTLRNWRSAGTGPAYIPLSANTVVYKVSDLEAWIDALPKVGA